MSYTTCLAVSLASSGLICAVGCTATVETNDARDAAIGVPDAAPPVPDANLPSVDAATPADAAVPVAADAAAVGSDAGHSSQDASAVTRDAGSAAPDAAGTPDASVHLPDASMDAAVADAGSQGPKRVLDVNDVSANPDAYDWFDFRPNLLKLILSGAEATEHIAILWYTIPDGTVGLHYHAQTESVVAIDGTQTDAKGVYPTGTVYFNPPGSGHAITGSSGFFILAYASPPDFASTDLIEEYTPIRIDTAAADFSTSQPFADSGDGLRTFEVPLDPSGGMSAQFMELTAPAAAYEYTGNYVLVLDGSCVLDGTTLGSGMLVVTRDVEPLPFSLVPSEGSTCLTMGISF